MYAHLPRGSCRCACAATWRCAQCPGDGRPIRTSGHWLLLSQSRKDVYVARAFGWVDTTLVCTVLSGNLEPVTSLPVDAWKVCAWMCLCA